MTVVKFPDILAPECFPACNVYPLALWVFFFLLDNCLALHFALEKLPQHFSFRKNRKA